MAGKSGKSSAYIWWLAWRNFSVRRHGAGLSFMTVVSVLGVTIGIGALVVVLSVMGGFGADLNSKMLAGEPNLEVISSGNALAGFSLKQHPITEFSGVVPEATAMEPFVSSDVVLKRRGYVTSATLIGVRPEMEGTKLWAFDGGFVDGTMADLKKTHRPILPQERGVIRDLPGIALGDQLALQIGADIGDEITVLSPQSSSSAVMAGGTLARQYVVIAKISTGLFSYDGKWAVTNLEEGRYFMPEYDPSLSEEEFVTGVAMNVPDPFGMDSIIDRIKKMDGMQPQTWQMTNRSLLFALKLEKFTMGSILMLIVVVAAFSISGTMMMTVFHKRGQVSVFRALGMSRRDISRLYLAHGFTIGTTGVVLGLVFGLGICFLIQSTRWFPLPEGAYYLRLLPVKFLPFEYGVICFFGWCFSLLASWYPAIAASRQNPSDGLRYE